ncbi:MAG: choice-of-anchor tandem repeat GloVer-containing protein [Terracidiphilus sp.]
MQRELLRSISALLVCTAMLALIGCSGGTTSGGGSNSGGNTTYTLSGTLSGLGSGQSVSLQDNGKDTLSLSFNGAFSFPTSLDTGSAYAVTVQSHAPGIACSVSNGSGTVGSSDVTGIGVSCTAGTETILYSFGASSSDGSLPTAGLIIDSAGNLYGTTGNGGVDVGGTVFKIGASDTETILHSFGFAADGVGPDSDLVMDSAGNFYGTTVAGGANVGTVFKVSPGTGGTYTETILYSFRASPADGASPHAGLIMDSAGNLYGTTYWGGANCLALGGCGTAFKVAPDGTETVLHSFGASATDGIWPHAGLVMDSAGNLYGTTVNGGANSDGHTAYGAGAVFKISPGAAGTYTETILYSFGASATDGTWPGAGLILDNAGNLYGTTEYGGANGYGAAGWGDGTVFKISASGTETILYSFGASATDGGGPLAGLIMDSAGNLYGTTAFGGANDAAAGGDGTVFEIGASGTETILYSFGASATDGQRPYAGLTMDGAGNLYGTTLYGGSNGLGSAVSGYGTVFVIN